MSESNRIQIVHRHQKVEEFAFRREHIKNSDSNEKNLDFIDYSAIGMKRLATIQSLSMKENWPFTIGNAFGAICSGFLGKKSEINDIAENFDDNLFY